MKIWIKGYVALSATIKIYNENKRICHKYFSKSFIRNLDKLSYKIERLEHVIIKQDNSLINSRYEYKREIVDNLHCALWELKETLNVGFEINLKRIPILQETIEVLQLVGLDYFECESKNAYLLVGNDLEYKFREDVICIGYTKRGHAGDFIIDNRIRHILKPIKRLK